MSLRDIKRRGRRDLHDRMKVPALYLLGAASPLPVHVRPHTKFKALGDEVVGGGGAERLDVTPRIIFDRGEVTPTTGAYVSVEPGEAYIVGPVMPDDDGFVTAYVTRMSSAQIAKAWPSGQPLPVAP